MGTNASEAEVSEPDQSFKACTILIAADGSKKAMPCSDRGVTSSIQDQELISLQTVGVSKSYKGRTVVRDVNIEVAQGEVVGLLGPNGAGKTTTFYMIVGLDPAGLGFGPAWHPRHHRSADVSAGEEWHQLSAAGGIGVPQADRGSQHHGDSGNACRFPGKERRDRLESLLEEFGIAHVGRAWRTRFREANGGAWRSRDRW